MDDAQDRRLDNALKGGVTVAQWLWVYQNKANLGTKAKLTAYLKSGDFSKAARYWLFEAFKSNRNTVNPFSKP